MTGNGASTGFEPAGYRSAAYARALAAHGRALPLGDTGGFVIARDVPGLGHGPDRTDLMGPYPLLCCRDWDRLGPALDALRGGRGDGLEAYVTLTFVTDPFCSLPPDRLAAMFDLCRPLHDHFLIDLRAPAQPSRHHRRKLRRAAQAGPLRIVAEQPGPEMLDDWAGLYDVLVARKVIGDLRAFDRDSFAHQLAVPGARIVTAWDGDVLLGADLYYIDGDVAYAHLSAYAEAGYARSVSYPMMAHAIDMFRSDPGSPIRWINLGGVPASEAAGGGIGHFKRGWTGLTRPSHLCGLILDRQAYAALCPAGPQSGYFPAYRAGEFKG